MHNAAAMGSGQNTKLGAKKIPSPADEAEAGAYRMASGQLYVPTIAFRSALLNAAKGLKINKKAASMIFAASVFVIEEYCPLFDAEGNPLHEYSIDSRRAVVQRQGIIRSRARIEEWNCVLALELTEMVGVAQVTQGLEMAGKIIGVLDFRVEKKGWFGLFKPELMEDAA